jgi:membrane-associated phospholipid phosphatase
MLGGFLLCYLDSTTLFAFINTHHSTWADTLMETMSLLGEGVYIVLIGLVLLLCKPFRNIYFFIGAILCTLLPSLLTQLLKHQFVSPRPMSVYEGAPWVHHLAHWALLHNNSFPSGHTTGAFGFMCFLACMLPKAYRYWGVLLFLFALSTAYARVYLAAHFFVDVYIGSIIGVVFSYLICWLLFYVKDKRLQQESTL